MTIDVSPTEDAVLAKVDAFVTSIVPTGTIVLRGPVNRAQLPKDPCVIYIPLFYNRLRTNLHTDLDPYPTPGGSTQIEMGTEFSVQVDFYGPDAGTWAAAAETLWRDEYACNMLNPECSPLYTDTARLMPLVTGEDQYLERYSLTVALQWNIVAETPQQFADAATAVLINVDEAYPA